MYILKGNQIKRILIVLFLICFFVLCSCHKEGEEPQETYSITYVINGHGEQPENLVDQTNLPDPLPELSEEWWIFEGWYFDRYFKKPATAGEVLVQDITLYAEWRKIPTAEVDYIISNEQAGTLIGETHQVIERGTDTTPVTVVPNIGYQFIGWRNEGQYEVERADEITRVDTNVQYNITAIAVFRGPITCNMDFRATQGGRVEGKLKQSVLYGDKGEPVTAIADEGFRFVRWSDGQTEAERENDCVTNSSSVIIAEFERYERTFKLEYNEATLNTELTEYTFYLDDMEKEQYLPVPQREGYEFMGWYSDWFHTVQVTDEAGKLIVGREWFTNDYIFYDWTNPDMKLFAKWEPIKEVPVYKILMIYVTEIHADLETSYYGTIQVDYMMSDLEKKQFELIALRMEEYLEAILNGTVDFQIDTYYTKEPLSEENFFRGTTEFGDKIWDDYGIPVDRGALPEVNDILDDYGSVMTSFCLNDNERKLHITGGNAGEKYGNIHLESMAKASEYMDDFTLQFAYSNWISMESLYIHEFTHTIEMQLNGKDVYGIHNAAQYLSSKGGAIKTDFDYLYSYLRNEFNIGDRNVGIPYEFWTGEYEKE